ncbi:MAG: hypothetical protein RJB60_3106 [Pseudomonadota bacterium]|jgi:hypothetical protein
MNTAAHDPSVWLNWLAAIATVALVATYEVVQRWRHQHAPEQHAPQAHADLREAWFKAVSDQVGSEIIAVQTLRNSLMSATLTTSTAALGLMGTVTLAASSLHAMLSDSASLAAWVQPRALMEVLLMVALFSAMACSAMAVRYLNHASYILSMPVMSATRQSWEGTGIHYLRRGGVLYGWGLRSLLMVAPLVVSIVSPLAGPLASLGLLVVLWQLDQVNFNEPKPLPQQA